MLPWDIILKLPVFSYNPCFVSSNNRKPCTLSVQIGEEICSVRILFKQAVKLILRVSYKLYNLTNKYVTYHVQNEENLLETIRAQRTTHFVELLSPVTLPPPLQFSAKSLNNSLETLRSYDRSYMEHGCTYIFTFARNKDKIKQPAWTWDHPGCSLFTHPSHWVFKNESSLCQTVCQSYLPWNYGTCWGKPPLGVKLTSVRHFCKDTTRFYFQVLSLFHH